MQFSNLLGASIDKMKNQARDPSQTEPPVREGIRGQDKVISILV
jgi:hypothetical protein